MQKPNSYNKVSTGGYIPPQVGGHKCVIKQVTETKNSKGKDMIVVVFDFAPDDVQPEFFSKEFKDDVRPDKKWPHIGTAYINTEDQDGKCSKRFKRFVTSFEKSNNCDAIWGEKFAGQFKNKKIGAVFGQKENEYNGKVTMRNELRYFCDIDKAEGAAVPDPIYLEKKSVQGGTGSGSSDGFMNIPDGVEDSIPWG